MPWMIRRWDIIVYFRENNFWQMGHLVCPLWMVLWCANESLRLKTLPHSLHTYFAGLPEVAVGAAGSQAPDSSYTHWATIETENHLYFIILQSSKSTDQATTVADSLYIQCFQSAFICQNEVQIVKGQKLDLYQFNQMKSNVIIIVRLQ